MDSRVKARWISLLESGEYKFGRARLYNAKTDCHCPLGVLVEMAIDEGVFEPVIVKYTFSDSTLFGVSSIFLSKEIRDWASISGEELVEICLANDTSDSYDPVVRYLRRYL